MPYSFPPWLLPVLASSILLGFYDVSKKSAVRDNSVMPVLFFSSLTGTVFFLAATMAGGGLSAAVSCTWGQFALVFLKSVLVSSSWTCVYYAMRELPISIAAPIRATSPLWTLLGGVLIFGEKPTLTQWVAMLVIFSGYYAFSVLGRSEKIDFLRHRGIYLILAGTILGAASALYDKYLLNVLKIPPLTLQFYFSLDIVAVLGTAFAVRSLFFGQKHAFHWRISIFLTGILLIAADYAYFYAVSLPDIQISVISLVRRCNVIVSFALGCYLFHDRNVRKKAFALLMILAGVALLALAK